MRSWPRRSKADLLALTIDRGPVARVTRPAFRPRLFGSLIEPLSGRQDGAIFATVPLPRCDIADAAVAMFLVVPLHEAVDPFTCRFQAREWLAWIGRRVLQRPKQTLRKRVVITHRRPTERRHDAKSLQSRQHGRALHRAAVVRVQHQAGFADTLGQTGLAYQDAGMRGLFVLVHFPAHDLPAEDVLHQVEPVESPADRRGQVGDVPRVNLVGALGLEALWLRYLAGRLRPTTPVLLAVLAQHAIEGRLGGQVFAFVGQPRHDL